MRILITGASKGIGLALAKECAKHGHDLVLVARSENELQKVTAELSKQYNVNVEYHLCDLSKSGSALSLYKTLKDQEKPIDCLINNAGIGYLGSFAKMGEEKLHDLMHINMISATELTHLYLKEFLSRDAGYILQLSSTASFIPGPFMAAYYASKAYLTNLSRALAKEIKGTNVSLSILCPGATRTNFFHEANMDNSMLEKGFVGMLTPEEVAKIAYKGMMKKKLFIIPGLMNKISVFLMSISPQSMGASIAAMLHTKSENK